MSDDLNQRNKTTIPRDTDGGLLPRLRIGYCEAGCNPSICMCSLAEEAADEIERLRELVITFCGPWAAQWGQINGLPAGHLHPQHYDLLKECGARMDDFKRAELEIRNEHRNDGPLHRSDGARYRRRSIGNGNTV